MSQTKNEAATVVGGNCGYGSVTHCPAQSHDNHECPEGVVQHACYGEKRARREGQRYNGRNDQSARAPPLEVFQQPCDFALSKLAVEIVQTCLACHSERQVGADDRACRGDCGVVVPRFALPCSEDGGKDVEAAKCWDGGTVDDRQKEQPESA